MDTELKRTELERAVIHAMTTSVEHPMRWGIDDCSLWCADVIRDVLGYDAGNRFRGKYKTRIGALRLLGRAGLLGAIEVASIDHGWRKIEQGDEAPGDIGLVTLGKFSAMAICRTKGWFVARGDAGFAALPTRQVPMIWAVI